ncbi:MAG TPA: hypothetical protein VFF33_07910 [Ignavibacteriaceae bacterium]|nr:hypothetical protein [Ignavibacteriaceae bacterium]
MNSKVEETEFAYQNPKMFDKTFINSQIINDKENEIYIIDYLATRIEIIRAYNPEEPIKVFIDGTLIDLVNKNQRKEILFYIKNEPQKLYVWNARAKSFFFTNFIFRNGLAATINDIPVKNTLSDPFNIIFEAKISMYLILVFLIIKSFVIPISQYKISPESAISNLVFYILLIIVLALGIYLIQKKPKTALMIGIIIGIVEFGDYLFGYFNSDIKTTQSLFFWSSIRIAFIVAIIRSYKSLNKLLKKIRKNNLTINNIDKHQGILNNSSVNEVNYSGDLNKEADLENFPTTKKRKPKTHKLYLSVVIILIASLSIYYGVKYIKYLKSNYYYEQGKQTEELYFKNIQTAKNLGIKSYGDIDYYDVIDKYDQSISWDSTNYSAISAAGDFNLKYNDHLSVVVWDYTKINLKVACDYYKLLIGTSYDKLRYHLYVAMLNLYEAQMNEYEFREGYLDKAIQHLYETSIIYDSSVINELYGEIYYWKNDYNRSIFYFKKSLSEKPLSWIFNYQNLSDALYQSNEYSLGNIVRAEFFELSKKKSLYETRKTLIENGMKVYRMMAGVQKYSKLSKQIETDKSFYNLIWLMEEEGISGKILLEYTWDERLRIYY